MFGKIKNTINTIRDSIFRRYIAHEIYKSMSLETVRNKVICCDFIVEADTSPQDEFELFKYLYAHKNQPFEPYYIINRNCSAYPEIKKQFGDNIIPYSADNIVEFAFFMRDLFKTTKFICGGFQVLHSLRIGITEAVKRSPYVYSFFTQHGITFFKDDFISQSSYSAFLFDKLMISNDFEKKIFMERACYTEDNLVKNGLFRWDLLSSDNAEFGKSIFIYFTHRRYLKNIPENELKNTVYVRTISGLLENPEFQKLVKENGYTLKIALHHSVLQVCGNGLLENVQILSDDEIAEAKRTSSILITDYSSMCFEMWFQHKPSIFLNIPDSEDCLKYNHKTDLADPYSDKKDYIFNIVDTVEDCVDKLRYYFNNGFRLTADEKAKRDRFFYYNGNFCERFYDYLVSMKNETKVLYHISDSFTDFARYPNIETFGIEYPSPEGRWIVRKKAYISFFIPSSDKNLAVQIHYEPYFYYRQYKFFVKIYVNGHKVLSREIFNRKKDYFVFEVPKEFIASDGKIKISFRLSHVYKRKHLKTGTNDPRRLSLRLLDMDIVDRDYSYKTVGAQMRVIQNEREIATGDNHD